tara:strand:+ start:280 stop:1317 length:1038 start_codon:yes stop_codon:yes gene_type:complete
MLKTKPLIIAEAGVNHNGSISEAKKLIILAKKAKADFIKFQVFSTSSLVTKKAKLAIYQKKNTSEKITQFEMLKKLELSFDKFVLLNNYCKKNKIKFLASPFDINGIKLLLRLKCKYIKIPSGEITNRPYLEFLGKHNKIIFLSTGMSTLSEVKDAVMLLNKNGTSKKNIYILQCNSEYPSPLRDVNLNAMLNMKKNLQLKIGFSDHTLGSLASIVAVSLGASVIEKHITLNKNKKGPDHSSSMNEKEFCQFTVDIKNISKLMGNGIKKPSTSEKKNISVARKSIYALSTINKGEKFTKKNLVIKRPFLGLNPMHINFLYGKKSNKKYKKNQLIKYNLNEKNYKK